ncbi:MAG: twin-arginine translocation pathway signal, partial [Rubrivivax sp.]|nr:twin-arginine translocation pathway signal [Rubrivivax sp.]
YRFITGQAAPRSDIAAEAALVLDGQITGLGLRSDDPASGNFTNNLPLAGAELTVYATDASSGERIGAAVHQRKVGTDGRWGPFQARPGVAYEFVVAAPGYATTHIYRSGFPRSSQLVHLRPERIADADKDAKALVTLTRPRGYFDLERDKVSFDGQRPPGVPPTGAGVSSAKLKLAQAEPRTIAAEFNGERLVGRVWPAADNRVVVPELTH